MAKFCSKCGSPLNGGAFCPACGTDMRQGQTPMQSQPPAEPSVTQQPASQPPAAQAAGPQIQPVQPASSPAAPAPPAATGPAKTSPLVKLAIAAVVIIFVGGALAAGGVYYIAHKVSEKVHDATGGLLGSSTSGEGSHSTSSKGVDVCRLLSKSEVGSAIGVEIIRTDSIDSGCSYIAKGDQADMSAKHATAMLASRGADKKTQQMAQAFAGGMFKMFQSERPPAEQDTSGEVPVFSFSVDQNAADMQMRLNARTLGSLGPTGAQGIPGVGDQAFVSGDSLLMVRKGDKLIRIMYMTCPCGTEAVIPLAKMLADRM
jgi:hypothetical protein